MFSPPFNKIVSFILLYIFIIIQYIIVWLYHRFTGNTNIKWHMDKDDKLPEKQSDIKRVAFRTKFIKGFQLLHFFFSFVFLIFNPIKPTG